MTLAVLLVTLLVLLVLHAEVSTLDGQLVMLFVTCHVLLLLGFGGAAGHIIRGCGNPFLVRILGTEKRKINTKSKVFNDLGSNVVAE